MLHEKKKTEGAEERGGNRDDDVKERTKSQDGGEQGNPERDEDRKRETGR